MKIKIIAVGKIKEDWISKGIHEYSKRIKNLDVIEIKDIGKEEEAKKLESLFKDNEEIILLSEEGDMVTSKELSLMLKGIEDTSKHACFVIGGPDGISDYLKAKHNKPLSLSQMTFTHEMARLFLIEQIYRAISIRQNKSYHR